MKLILLALSSILVSASVLWNHAVGKEWTVPVAGNAFPIAADHRGRLVNGNEHLLFRANRDGYLIYFHVDRPCSLDLSARGLCKEGSAKIVASIGSSTQLFAEFNSDQLAVSELGNVEVSEPGYVCVALNLAGSATSTSLEIKSLTVACSDEDLALNFVADNEGGMFYWGRRGPSVHLSYQFPSNLPRDSALTYAYSEILVPPGSDPIGSYFMANGFSEGYFGIQVNSESERRVLFSVWSPFKTDNPREIPAGDRVELLAKGNAVRSQDFGNEGSGGQSYLVYPWLAGRVYRFLTEVKPDGNGATVYTSWFGDKATDEWLLIASFRRPKTDKHLTGFHSFLENFSPEHGHLQRLAYYSNQYVGDASGKWYSIAQAKFTGDATARGHHRLDFAGGVEGGKFFLQNCGFFSPSVELDQLFQRRGEESPPQINFESLPR